MHGNICLSDEKQVSFLFLTGMRNVVEKQQISEIRHKSSANMFVDVLIGSDVAVYS